MYTWYCSFLTLRTILGVLGMLSAGFYRGQTPDIFHKMLLICSCKTRIEVWYHTLYFYQYGFILWCFPTSLRGLYFCTSYSFSVTNTKKIQCPTILWPRPG